MSTILAIDPGPDESAYVWIDADTCRVIHAAKLANLALLRALADDNALGRADLVAIEMIAAYGMPVGIEVFETCVWIGRYAETIHARTGAEPRRIPRGPVKIHHCHDSRAKDSNIIQALVDRFAPGQPNRGKGTKAAPGWFHGFAGDIWQSYALAVYIADTDAGPASGWGVWAP